MKDSLFLLDYFADIGLYDMWGRSLRGEPRLDPAGHDRGMELSVSFGWSPMIAMATEKDSIRFSALFSPAEVICQTRETERDKALLEMLRRLARRRAIGDVEEVYEAVLARENDLPTVVAPGMAMPHAKLEGIDDLLVAVTTSRDGIVYDANQSDNRVKLIVLTLAPKTAQEAYLQAISGLARICRDPSTAEAVAALTTPEQVWAFFDKGGATRPDAPRPRSGMTRSK